MFVLLIVHVRLNLRAAMSRMVADVQFRDVRWCYSTFETRWHMRRNRIWSFSETDESI